MDFTVLTLFPEFLEAFFSNGMIARAMDKGLIQGSSINIRDFSTDKHNTVDDRPYGGGCGMVMKPGPLEAAIDSAKQRTPSARVIMMTPQGSRFNQRKALELAANDKGLIFVCGRYEGIDERVYARLVDEEISMGDYVMTGGEIAAMAMIDATARMIPGVLGKEGSFQADSFMDDRLEHAQYTRPKTYKDMEVPQVLLSGNHGKIRDWRKESALHRTFLKRPDLFDTHRPTEGEKDILRKWCHELEALINMKNG